MTEVPKPANLRPWAALESGVLLFEPSAYGPQPVNERPWYRIKKCVVIYDAKGAPVSAARNGEWLFHVDQCHDPLKDALYGLLADFQIMARLAGYSQHVIDQALASPIAALAKAGVKVGQ